MEASTHAHALTVATEKCRENLKLDLSEKQVAAIVKSYLKASGSDKPIGWAWEGVLHGVVVKDGVTWEAKKPNMKDKVAGVTFRYRPLYSLPDRQA